MSDNKDLVGMYFHSRAGAEIVWQGVVVGYDGNDQIIVQLFSWVDGGPTVKRRVWRNTIVREAWSLFDSRDEMMAAYEAAAAAATVNRGG